MAFIRTPDSISIELPRAGAALPPAEAWTSMTKPGSWQSWKSPGAVIGFLGARNLPSCVPILGIRLQHALTPSVARNAFDWAFCDIDAKRAYRSVAELARARASPPAGDCDGTLTAMPGSRLSAEPECQT
jgi:hypothetical protein